MYGDSSWGSAKLYISYKRTSDFLVPGETNGPLIVSYCEDEETIGTAATSTLQAYMTGTALRPSSISWKVSVFVNDVPSGQLFMGDAYSYLVITFHPSHSADKAYAGLASDAGNNTSSSSWAWYVVSEIIINTQ